MKKTVLIAAVIVAAVTAVTIYVEKRSYHNYKIVTVQRAGGRNLNQLCGDGWRYSAGTVRTEFRWFLTSMDTLWSETYQMQNPDG